jgi:hypothetical protein
LTPEAELEEVILVVVPLQTALLDKVRAVGNEFTVTEVVTPEVGVVQGEVVFSILTQ